MKKIGLGLAFVFCLISPCLHAQPLNIYVLPTGAATGSGSSTANPVSLARARAIAKTTANKTITCHIWLMDGVYSYLALDSTDSRTAAAPVTYHSLNPLKAIFQPITPINPADILPLPDSIKNRVIDTNARKKVKQVNLASYKLSNMNTWPKTFSYPVSITATTNSRQQWPIIYQNTTPLPMAQYPNNDVMRIKRVLTNGTGNTSPGGTFVYRDDRAKYWGQAIKDGLWLRGSWRVDWQMDFVKTDSISLTDSIVYQTIGVQGGIGNKYARPAGNGKEPYVAVNLVEEIDAVGEWSINFATKMLYIYPPDTGTLNISSNSATQSIKLTGVNYTNFEGFKLDGGSSDGVLLSKCNYVTLAGMEITHVAGYGVFITNGTNCTVRSNDIHDVGEGGVFLINSNFTADQLTLTPCNHKVVNNHIYDYAKDVFLYAAAVDTRSVIGCYTAFNRIHGCQHVGVLYGGNNNRFEYNDISDVVGTYTDMGAFYGSENQTERGNTFYNNYVHDMHYKGSGLYTDNWYSGQLFTNNIITNCLYGSQNNFGYSNNFYSNIYYNNSKAHHTNATGFLPDTNKSNLTNYTNLKKVYNASTIYQQAYPDLADLFPTTNSAYTSLIWPQLKGNVFIGTAVGKACLNGVADKSLFNTNGTTNSNFAQTGSPFKQNGLVFQQNLLMGGALFNAGNNNLLDSLKSTGAFAKTTSTNWHIARVGLFKDSIYRPSITTTQTPGVTPAFTLAASKHGLLLPDTLGITVTIKNPNINNSYSAVALYDNDTLLNLPLTLQKASFDSIVLTAQWQNPSIGKHTLVAHLLDSTVWDFPSSPVAFSISSPLPVTISRFIASPSGCGAIVSWEIADEANVQTYQVQQSDAAGIFTTVKTILAANNGSNNNYTSQVPQAAATAYYRLLLQTNTGQQLYSQTAKVQAGCLEKETLALLPNPSQKGSTASLSYKNVSPTSIQSAIAIYYATGKMVYQQPVSWQKGDNQYKLPTLPTGMYIIKLLHNGMAVKWQVL
ncbi:right-handed parallel beta-helix repeat-containing protein [Parasediminibacterium sp. JCM 36343]|uniref:right-handed parallel beta-helix repeat-containing protein n=1 Tax=Parasediminibacterium sp. JCM 36343 TaxID=3374279 RepID=UPI00397D8169